MTAKRGAKPLPYGGKIMENLYNKRYLIKSNSYMIDLFNVDFITWKENENETGTYWVKLHIGTKEARYVCSSLEELHDLIKSWTRLRGEEIKIEEEDLIW
tara:strand:- start:178 stop:477 length:300 start_codon:yes stop_codon:yes gene_type:complete